MSTTATLLQQVVERWAFLANNKPTRTAQKMQEKPVVAADTTKEVGLPVGQKIQHNLANIARKCWKVSL